MCLSVCGCVHVMQRPEEGVRSCGVIGSYEPLHMGAGIVSSPHKWFSLLPSRGSACSPSASSLLNETN